MAGPSNLDPSLAPDRKAVAFQLRGAHQPTWSK
jgi:hypothetical protein